MTARKWAAWVLLTFLGIFLDTAVLRFVSLYGIRPSVVLALALATAEAFSVQSGLVIAAVGGLTVDVICSTTLGLTPACYRIEVLLYYACVKAPTKRAGVRYVRMLLCAFASGALLFLSSLLLGTAASIPRTLLFLVLPGALLTAAVGLGLFAWLRAMQRGQVERI